MLPRITIRLPEPKVNLANEHSLIEYLTKMSPLAGGIAKLEVGQRSPLVIRVLTEGTPASIPITITVDTKAHFLVVVDDLPETQAALLWNYMWNQPVAHTGFVCPFTTKITPDRVAITVAGALPAVKLPVSIVDEFIVELIQTSMFVLKCRHEQGPRPPRSSVKPNWVDEAAKREAEGPRRSEFILEEKPEEIVKGSCCNCGKTLEVPKSFVKGDMGQALSTSLLCPDCPKKEESTDDHQS